MKRHHQVRGTRRKRWALAAAGGVLLFLVSGGAVLAANYWLPVTGSGCQVWSDEPLKSSGTIRWSGGRGAAAGAMVGGIAGAARAERQRERAAYYQQQELEWERRRLEEERYRLEQERRRLQQQR